MSFNTNGWAKNPDHWGTYSTEDGTRVEMLRKGQRVRFYDADGVQHGPEHKNVAPAITWVAAETNWVDTNDAYLGMLVRKEVRETAR